MKRILWAGLLGGIAMFFWEGLAHNVLPLGTAGVKAAPNEAAFIATVKENFRESGFYFFPAPPIGTGLTGDALTRAQETWMQKWTAGPAGIMVVQANGGTADQVGPLLRQCVFDIVAMLLAALLLSRAAFTGYASRAGFVGLLALFPILSVDLPYWNWYGFPTAYTMAMFVTRVVGYLIGGLVVGAMAPRYNNFAARLAK